MTTMHDLAPGQMRPSPTNPRKTFTGLDELGASLIEKGVIVPVLVRPTPTAAKAKEPYELVCGERRWRAATKAKLTTIPAVVCDLSDREVLEIQLVENLQRVDVHPLEEADGYEELLEKHGYDVDGIAAKTGKSKAYIYARLKLGALAPGPRVEFLQGRISASRLSRERAKLASGQKDLQPAISLWREILRRDEEFRIDEERRARAVAW